MWRSEGWEALLTRVLWLNAAHDLSTVLEGSLKGPVFLWTLLAAGCCLENCEAADGAFEGARYSS